MARSICVGVGCGVDERVTVGGDEVVGVGVDVVAAVVDVATGEEVVVGESVVREGVVVLPHPVTTSMTANVKIATGQKTCRNRRGMRK